MIKPTPHREPKKTQQKNWKPKKRKRKAKFNAKNLP